MLFKNNADVVGSIFVALFIANVMMFIIQSGLMRYFAKIILIPKHILLPIVGIMCVVGTFSVNNRVFDLWVLMLFGFVGYILIKNRFSLGPIVLGYILGPLIETNWRLGLMAARGNYLSFLTRPLSALLLAMAVVSLVFPLIRPKIGKRSNGPRA
jgi:putative tricarboxylic transport membrane protein